MRILPSDRDLIRLCNHVCYGLPIHITPWASQRTRYITQQPTGVQVISRLVTSPVPASCRCSAGAASRAAAQATRRVHSRSPQLLDQRHLLLDLSCYNICARKNDKRWFGLGSCSQCSASGKTWKARNTTGAVEAHENTVCQSYNRTS
jgi:hypothetical protein